MSFHNCGVAVSATVDRDANHLLGSPVATGHLRGSAERWAEARISTLRVVDLTNLGCLPAECALGGKAGSPDLSRARRVMV